MSLKSITLRPIMLPLALLALPLSLSACGSDEELQTEELDATLSDTDPEANVALDDRILVDRDLNSSSNNNAVQDVNGSTSGARPADKGSRSDALTLAEIKNAPALVAPAPGSFTEEECDSCGKDSKGATLGARAESQSLQRGKGTCDAKLEYGAAWANRMPAEFPVYPRGRVLEAAGIDGGKCDIRVVSFASNVELKKIVDYYYSLAKHSGYSAEYVLRSGEHTLGGVRDVDGGAYVITFNKRAKGGTVVDIVANNGR